MPFYLQRLANLAYITNKKRQKQTRLERHQQQQQGQEPQVTEGVLLLNFRLIFESSKMQAM